MRQYALNMLMAVDQFLSTVLGGHPDDTISQRLGRAKVSGGGWVVTSCAGIVDALAFILARESNHCVRSLEGKALARELWNWGGSRDQVKVEDI
jgi:hypothetical protein